MPFPRSVSPPVNVSCDTATLALNKQHRHSGFQNKTRYHEGHQQDLLLSGENRRGKHARL